MKAIHFGAGNIGRGFIGKLLADTQIELTFADINQPLVDQLETQQSYRVNVVGKDARIEQVSNIRAVNSASPDAVRHIAQADLLTTAVGPQVLEKIAGTLAQGLIARYQSGNHSPLNIIACENMVRGTHQLKQYVIQYLPMDMLEWLEEHIGFIDSAVDRIVPPGEAANDPLDVTVETFSEWIVDGTQFKGELPKIAGMEPTTNLMAYIERKLFTLNTGHAITAYLGRLAGCPTIREAILNPQIRQIVKGAMEESGAVLIKRYDFSPVQHAAYIDKIIDRFENPYLRDDVERVGRQPLRKLGENDRLIKPLRGALEYGLPYTNLAFGIAAALHYENERDPQAKALADMLATQGVEETLRQVCALGDREDVITQIVKVYNSL